MNPPKTMGSILNSRKHTVVAALKRVGRERYGEELLPGSHDARPSESRDSPDDFVDTVKMPKPIIKSHNGSRSKGCPFKVARLQREFWHEICFFELRIFLRKTLQNFPKFFSLCFVGPKKSRKIPTKFPTNFPCEQSSKNIHRQASAGARGEGCP